MRSINFEIKPKSVVVTFALLAVFLIIYQMKELLLFLFASFIIASALMPIIDGMSKKMKRPVAVALVYLVIFLLVLTIFIPFFAIFTDQSQEFIKQFPRYFGIIENQVLQWKSTSQILGLIPDHNQILSAFAKHGESIVSQSINLTINIFGAIIAFFTLATIVLFILLDKDSLKKGFLSFFPADKRDTVDEIAVTISKRVGGYVRGQLAVMVAVGIVTGFCLVLLNIPFAFLLGMVAGLLEIVPIIGPLFSVIPAALLALAIHPWLAVAVIVLYFIIQRVENFVAPFVYGKFLDMPPLVIIIALLVAASTLGLTGVVLAPAIAAAVYVLVQELYLKKINP